MRHIEREILNALLELENAAAQPASTRPKTDLRALLARVDALAAQLPEGTNPRLLHFLYRKSYQKARVHLQERQ